MVRGKYGIPIASEERKEREEIERKKRGEREEKRGEKRKDKQKKRKFLRAPVRALPLALNPPLQAPHLPFKKTFPAFNCFVLLCIVAYILFCFP
jgi:hypothetical protein